MQWLHLGFNGLRDKVNEAYRWVKNTINPSYNESRREFLRKVGKGVVGISIGSSIGLDLIRASESYGRTLPPLPQKELFRWLLADALATINIHNKKEIYEISKGSYEFKVIPKEKRRDIDPKTKEEKYNMELTILVLCLLFLRLIWILLMIFLFLYYLLSLLLLFGKNVKDNNQQVN